MKCTQPSTILATTRYSVKTPLQLPLPGLSGTMIHHKVRDPHSYLIVSSLSIERGRRYGVSSSFRILSPGLFRRRYDRIRDFLGGTLGLTCSQREVVLRLLRLWAYYGKVYPKAAQVAQDPGASRATFWRTVRLLKEKRLIEVTNRFFIRPEAQTSNLYRFDRLLVAIARYLAEAGHHFVEAWLQPLLEAPGGVFWPAFWSLPRGSPPPGVPAPGPG